MNAALIHDKLFIKGLWEKRITNHSQMTENEELRMKNSALSKLRDEWLIRLENRTKHIKNFNDRHAIMPTEDQHTDQE
ncbi:protein FAM240C [Hemibagrus wyckioides]|uniref:protein FAM240C n=1 Tax=Hemibagrus wyckioides TaxID=337641 RepID=UPI00266B8F7F|nr:protein FAM240C [Hemibagrus wyckioides]XP_058245476.1 protein FAM240C [Hemibagrus wyckioides]XP_058245477.1 protein FAM240C [Hemibagrus wyckioides]